MKAVAVTIEKPVQEVWDFFTDLPKWKSWWDVAPTKASPGWQTGGTLVFNSGEENDLTVTPLKDIRITSRWIDSIYRFEAVGAASTLVEYEFIARGGASFSDDGLGHMREMASTLRKLKKAVGGSPSVPKKERPSARSKSESGESDAQDDLQHGRNLVTEGRFSRQKFDQALDHLKRAITREPLNPEAYCLRGMAYVKFVQSVTEKDGEPGVKVPVKQFVEAMQKARRDFDKAIELDPDYPLSWLQKGLICHISASFNKHLLGGGVPRGLTKDFVKRHSGSAKQALDRFIEVAPGTKWESEVPTAQELLRTLPSGGACFIATACYGTQSCSEVATLQHFRDTVLLHCSNGRLGVRLYYLCSPPLARFLCRHPWFSNAVKKWILDRLVATIVRILEDPRTNESSTTS